MLVNARTARCAQWVEQLKVLAPSKGTHGVFPSDMRHRGCHFRTARDSIAAGRTAFVFLFFSTATALATLFINTGTYWLITIFTCTRIGGQCVRNDILLIQVHFPVCRLFSPDPLVAEHIERMYRSKEFSTTASSLTNLFCAPILR